MKLKNLLLLGSFLLMGFLTGCIDEDDPIQKVSSVMVVLSTDEVQTKAAEGYSIATNEEINIRNYMIAVFKDNLCVAFLNQAPSGTTTYEGKKAYTESFTDLPAGDLTFLVIANSSASFSGLGVGSDYASFEGLTESSLTAGALVKTGQTTVTLDASSEAQSVHVTLYQLTARLDFGTVTVSKENEETVQSEDTRYGEWSYLSETNATNAALLNEIDSKDGYWNQNYYFVGQYAYLFMKRTVTITKSSSTGSFIVNSKQVSGFNIASDLILNPDTQKIENTQFAAGDAMSFDKTFYTYESSSSSNIKLTVNCKIGGNGVVETFTQYGYIRFTYDEGAWNEGVETDIDFDKTTPETSESSGNTGISYDYTLLLPFNSKGISLKKGHRYTINGTYTQYLSGKPTISWYVSDLGPITNDITHN